MNKDFIAEELDNDMQEEKEEGLGGDHGFPDDEKKKKACGRRGSSGGGGVSPPSCQVEKCGLDLSDFKRYHRRHKVCEIQAKAPFVVVSGLRRRFCQQCSRFHELLSMSPNGAVEGDWPYITKGVGRAQLNHQQQQKVQVVEG